VQFLTLAAIIDAVYHQLVTAKAIEVDEEVNVMSLFNPLDWVYDSQPTYWPCLPTLNYHACM